MMNRMTNACALALAAVALAAPCDAQTVAGAPPVDTAACELHIWPAERFSAMTTGWLGAGLIDYAVHEKGDQQRKSVMSNALDSPSQTAALASMNLAGLLKQKPFVIVKHDEPLERHTVNDIKTRRSSSQSPCYSELIVADIFYQKAAIYGRSLKTLFIYRDFGAAPTAGRIYKNWGGNGLKLFPPKPGDDLQAASDELVNVFKADFEEFARNEAAAQHGS